jgi:4-hydroxy 2-oxovalerate aldolase
MKDFQILDCTLRDGGYYTNWDFENSLVEKYIQAMIEIPADIIEIGYRSTPIDEYAGKYFYLPDFAIDFIAGLNKGKKLALMLNEKSTKQDDLSLLLKGLSGKVHIIRLAVNPEAMENAILLAEEIKQQGFEVAINLMYMSDYFQNEQFLSSLGKFNDKVDYVTLVDSYGGMMPSHVSELFRNAGKYCNARLGFHGHNNMELAFANSLAAINAGCRIVDCTILGMGRGAGNLKTELLLTYLVSQQEAEFDFNVLSGLVESWIPLQHKYGWGSNLPYMFSGANSLPQKDVMEWVTQRYYSFNSIIRALHHQKNGGNDDQEIRPFYTGQNYENVIIIGGGDSARLHADAVIRFVSSFENVCLVHASSKNARYYEHLNNDQFFCLVGSEGKRMEDVFNDLNSFKGICVLPPSPRKMGTYIPERLKHNACELSKVDFTDLYQDSHTALALQTAKELGATQVYLAGYDGYSQDTITLKEQGLIVENDYLFAKFREVNRVTSLFTTKYTVDTQSVYALIN